MPPVTPWRWFQLDPRHGQIATLALLAGYGVWRLGFDIGPAQAAVTVATALGIQAAADRWTGRPITSGAKSASISALSLCLLLRTDHLVLAAVASAIAILSKFTIRVAGKHVFNPTNLALVALLLTTDAAWVSPGQWGTQAALAFAFACAGLLVVHRAARADVTVAFIGAYAAMVAGRSLWLGEPMTIPLHRLESGAFLLFAFFMISDPKTTPDSRPARVLFAIAVAAGAWYVHFRLFRTNGFLWALALASPFVPLLDRLLPAAPYHWPATVRSMAASFRRSSMVRRVALVVLSVLGLGLRPDAAEAFCGLYVARADTRLFNKASQVVLVRDGDRTVLTMANDFRGDLKEFAMVIPVPTSITREQIHVGDKALLDHLDAFTAPRLVEYFDADPCARMERRQDLAFPMAAPSANEVARRAGARSLGVTIEAQYTVGEYDILILSATQSSGLEQWLRQNGYRIPAGATDVLGTYIRQNMRFFVARVNLGEQAKLGYSSLRPLQVAYESPKFMLPIRLGMVNADGAQELFVYALTRKGRIETTNYRTVKLRTDVEIPTYLKDPAEFGRMYRAMFARQVQQEQMRAVFLEYAWDMAWCDPCAADPLTADELRRLGVFWLEGWGDDALGPWSGRTGSGAAGSGGTGSGDTRSGGTRSGGTSVPPTPTPRFVQRPAAPQDVFVTRLHVRYDQAHFPEDLVFQETGDRTNFQGRYVLRHAWQGPVRCEAAESYLRSLPDRHEREAQTLVSLTGWAIDEIRTRMGLPAGGGPVAPAAVLPWWRRIWG